MTFCAWIGFTKASAAEGIVPHAATYFVACIDGAAGGDGSQASPLRTLGQVNALALHPGDAVLFKRGSTCMGELQPRGSGIDGTAIRIGAYGEGPLPRIQAGATDEAALRLFNQSYWEIGSLDLAGGTTYGLYAAGDTNSLHHLYVRDLLVHDVHGPLKHKESGLVVIRLPGEQADFEDIQLDGVHAYNTTQWSGIFVSGASHVRVRNSTAHDVQGDGIVVFHARDAMIARSAAWHTGLQQQLTIGTPNAIWTWKCTDCTVEQNEAFLTDSPGVDGGAFDIDTGNARNAVRDNFGHDTSGYCVSVFGAQGPTTDSMVADNLCLNNGMSPRLAQRQGAILLMTWQGGSLRGVEIRGNEVDWRAAGETPAVRAGADLQAAGVVLRSNKISSSGLIFVDPALKYAGDHNRYEITDSEATDLDAAMPAFKALREAGSTLTRAANGRAGWVRSDRHGWRLELRAASTILLGPQADGLRGALVQIKSAALQYGQSGLEVSVRGDAAVAALVNDWELPGDGVVLEVQPAHPVTKFSLKLLAPDARVVREWRTCPAVVDLGRALRQNIGSPDFARLPFEHVRATD